MKRKSHRQAEHSADPLFLQALYEDDSSHRSNHRQAQRKTSQFCRQVQRALNLALADLTTTTNLGGVFIADVLPAPDCGRLLVHILLPPDLDVPTALADLHRLAPSLRAEVARAITRKRAPELTFAPSATTGGADD